MTGNIAWPGATHRARARAPGATFPTAGPTRIGQQRGGHDARNPALQVLATHQFTGSKVSV